MTAKIDGTNGVLQQYDYQVPTTGFSYTFAAGTTVLVMNPAGTLATGTITMPASPVDGMTISFSSTKQITALTVQGNTGQSIVGAPTVLPANQAGAYVYRLSNTTWYPYETVPTNVPVTPAGGSAITSGTAQNSTSGTSIDFTGIPSWVKRVTVMLNGVSLSGTDGITLQLGDSGGIEATGYVGNRFDTNDAGAINVTAFSTSFLLTSSGGGSAAGNLYSGQVILSLFDASTNTWVMNGGTAPTTTSTTARICLFAGSKSLSSTLTQLSIGRSGTNTFDAGSINILYE